MNKQAFLDRLREGLAGLPEEDAAERRAFYGDMIDDRMEDGLSEEEAVAAVGPAEAVVEQVIAETPLPKIVRERIRPKRRLRGWEIALLALGSPVWVPLLIAAFAVLFSVYVVLWALIVSLWAVWISFIAGALGGAAAGAAYLAAGKAPQGLFLIGAALVLAGLSIPLFFACKAATKGAARLTKKIARGIKSLFLGKESSK